MTKVRFLFANAFVVVFCGAHLYIIWADRQQEKQKEWPLLYYPMFSRLKDWSFRKNLLVGIADEPGEREVPFVNPRYLRPLGMRDVHRIVEDFQRRENGRILLQAALRDFFTRYERLRRRKAHAGPPLRAVRLYRERWNTGPGFIPPAPASRTLLMEFAPSP